MGTFNQTEKNNGILGENQIPQHCPPWSWLLVHLHGVPDDGGNWRYSAEELQSRSREQRSNRWRNWNGAELCGHDGHGSLCSWSFAFYF